MVGSYSNYRLLTFSVTRMPNIMKVRQCFLELRLKMSGMFFWRHSVYRTTWFDSRSFTQSTAACLCAYTTPSWTLCMPTLCIFACLSHTPVLNYASPYASLVTDVSALVHISCVVLPCCQWRSVRLVLSRNANHSQSSSDTIETYVRLYKKNSSLK